MAKKKRKLTVADLDQYADIGMAVRYYPQADETSRYTTGYVSARGHGTALTVNVITQDHANCVPMDGVRHMDDPGARTAELAEQGGWRHVPLTLATLRMLMLHDIIRWAEDAAGNPVLDVTTLDAGPPPVPEVAAADPVA